jgi:hypothetical protein
MVLVAAVALVQLVLLALPLAVQVALALQAHCELDQQLLMAAAVAGPKAGLRAALVVLVVAALALVQAVLVLLQP